MLSSNSHAVFPDSAFWSDKRFLNFFAPSRCPVCNERSDDHSHNPHYASDCWTAITKYEGPACAICGLHHCLPLYQNLRRNVLTINRLFEQDPLFRHIWRPAERIDTSAEIPGVKRLSITPLPGWLPHYNRQVTMPSFPCLCTRQNSGRENSIRQLCSATISQRLYHHLCSWMPSAKIMKQNFRPMSAEKRGVTILAAPSAHQRNSGASILLVDECHRLRVPPWQKCSQGPEKGRSTKNRRGQPWQGRCKD